jgi:hypothetical protein
MAQVVVEMSGDSTKLQRAYQEAIDKINNLDNTTKKAGRAHQEAFGGRAVTEMMGYLGGLVSITKGLEIFKTAIREVIAEGDRLAAKQKENARGLGPLLQLSAISPNPRAEMDRLLGESRATFGEGGAETMGAAGQMQFQATSANLDRYRRAMSTLVGINAVQDPQSVFRGVSALQRSMGAENTGDMEHLISMALGASAGAPIRVEELLMAMAKPGSGARQLGLSTQELLAGGAVQSGIAGSAEGGGELMAALLRSIEKVGIEQTHQLKPGRSLSQYVGDIAALEERGISPWRTLGARGEAVQAYRNLRNNMPEYERWMGQESQAISNNAFQTMVDMGGEFPELAYPLLATQSRNREELSAERSGSRAQLEQAVMAQQVESVRRQGGSELDAYFERFWGGFERFMYRWGGDDQFLIQNRQYADPQTQQAIDNFLRASETLNRAADNLGNNTGRQRAVAGQQPE